MSLSLSRVRFLERIKLQCNLRTHRKQKTRVNNSIVNGLLYVWGTAKLNFGTTSINIFLADLFHIHSDIDIANLADDNTPYLSDENVKDVLEPLERASVSLFRWFENTLLKGNADKCHFPVSTSQDVSLNVNNFKIKNSDCDKLLGVKFDSKLTFDQHITDLCRGASRKYTH